MNENEIEIENGQDTISSRMKIQEEVNECAHIIKSGVYSLHEYFGLHLDLEECNRILNVLETHEPGLHKSIVSHLQTKTVERMLRLRFPAFYGVLSNPDDSYFDQVIEALYKLDRISWLYNEKCTRCGTLMKNHGNGFCNICTQDVLENDQKHLLPTWLSSTEQEEELRDCGYISQELPENSDEDKA
jgi:hypothetical protein